MATRTWLGGGTGTWGTAGNWSGGAVPTLNDDVIIDANTGPNVTTAAVCKSLTCYGFVQGTSTMSIYGDITLFGSQSGIIATGVWTILNTAGQTTYNITSAGTTFNCSLVLNAGTGSTYRLVKADSSANGNLTFSSLRTLTLTTGILDLNGYNLSVGLFSSSNSNTRSITFSSDHSNNIALTGVGTVFSQTTSAGWSYTGYSDFTVSDASGSAKTVTTTGMSTYPANFYFTGAGTVTLTSGNYFLNLDAYAFSGTLSKSSSSVMNIGASLLLGSNVTSGIGGSGVTTFSLVSGLGGSLATGTLDLTSKNWGPMTFSSGAWRINGYVGTSAATNAVICSGGSLLIAWDFYCYTFTISGGTVTVDESTTLFMSQTSSSSTAFGITSGIFRLYRGSVYCNVVAISGGFIEMDINSIMDGINCLRMNFSGSASWNGLDSGSYFPYTDYSNGPFHIRHRSVASNWSSGFSQSRYQSTSTNIIVLFTTYDTASSTLRNITDTSGIFAFTWEGTTLVQRFGIASGSTIGGLSLYYLSPSTFEGGYNFTCNGSFIEDANTYRTLGGTITFIGGTSTLSNYLSFNDPVNWPFSMTFSNNGYFQIFPSYLTAPSPTSSFIMAGATVVSKAQGGLQGVYLTFATVNLNQSGTNNFICENLDAGTGFNVTATNGTVINARGVGLTIKGNLSFYLQATAVTGAGRTVNLPTASNYYYSTATYKACTFSDDGLTDTITIGDNSFLYSISLTNNNVTFTNLYLQNTFYNYSTATGSSLFLLGILPSFYYGNNTSIQSGASITNVYVGNSVITNTNVAMSINGGSVTNLTHNSGSLSLGGSGSLANTTILSTNPASSSTVTIGYYSPNPLYLQNLTIGTTGTITITDDTNLATYPNNVSTWELGGRIIPNITVLPNSTLNITDVSNSGTTYIKDISAGGQGTVPPPTVVYSNQSISVAGGSVTHSYNESTKTLTFSLYGGGGSVNGQTINLYYNINTFGTTVANYSYNWAVSSESGYDKGSINIGGTTVVDRVSGSGVSSGSGTVTFPSASTWQLATMTYTKDGSQTAGSDTFSGSIVFTFSGGDGTSIVRFQASRTFTFDKFFRNSSTQLLTIGSDQSGVSTNLRIPVNNLGTLVHGSNPGSIYTATIQDCAVTSTNYMWFAGKNSVNAGNNSGWIFGASPTTQTNVQFFL
jgi:hypothetical protein